MAGENMDGLLQRLREVFVEVGQVKVDDGVVQKLLLGERLVIVGGHGVAVERTEPGISCQNQYSKLYEEHN